MPVNWKSFQFFFLWLKNRKSRKNQAFRKKEIQKLLKLRNAWFFPLALKWRQNNSTWFRADSQTGSRSIWLSIFSPTYKNSPDIRFKNPEKIAHKKEKSGRKRASRDQNPLPTEQSECGEDVFNVQWRLQCLFNPLVHARWKSVGKMEKAEELRWKENSQNHSQHRHRRSLPARAVDFP